MELNNKKILIIDDDVVLQTILEKSFQKVGCRTRIAFNGKTGVEIAEKWDPDIILLDINLPDTSGIDILDMMRAEPKFSNKIICLMSADSSDFTAVMGLSKKADDFIHKPIMFSQLVVKLRNWLTAKQYKDKLEELNEKLGQERVILSRFFPEDIVDKIISGDLNDKLSGENLTVSILFFDIRNFTKISESIEPDQVADLLNLLFTDIMDLILSHQGSVNKLIGDAILATFGCPVNTETDALNSVKCALAIRENMKNFNSIRPKYLKEDLKYGIGITTGNVFAGNIGSYRRMEYTVIGDAVNTASRLQSLSKKIDYDIFIDGNTREKLKSQVRTKKILLKGIRGKQKNVDVFVLTGLSEKKISSSRKVGEVTFF